MKNEKILLRRHPQQISEKNSESKWKDCREKFLKNMSFGVDFFILMYKINAYGVRS